MNVINCSFNGWVICYYVDLYFFGCEGFWVEEVEDCVNVVYWVFVLVVFVVVVGY